jgi:hypothetical protein
LDELDGEGEHEAAEAREGVGCVLRCGDERRDGGVNAHLVRVACADAAQGDCGELLCALDWEAQGGERAGWAVV